MTINQSNIQIRKGISKDKNAIASFQLKMAWETELLELDLGIVDAGVQKIIDEPVRGSYWVAEYQGQVVGSLLVLFEWSDWRNGEVLWIHSVYITPEFRNFGIFKKMYLQLKNLVEESENYRGLRLYVDKTNQNAQKVYKAIGMTNEHYELFEWLK
ncbi:MAG: GNAT family N-acetyltransferase [Flammeovirgaceae bacterium]|nr:GNAT family N-acetyltransferase [Flammeovirgaceae bacterium]